MRLIASELIASELIANDRAPLLFTVQEELVIPFCKMCRNQNFTRILKRGINQHSSKGLVLFTIRYTTRLEHWFYAVFLNHLIIVLDPVGSWFDKIHIMRFSELELVDNDCCQFVARIFRLGWNWQFIQMSQVVISSQELIRSIKFIFVLPLSERAQPKHPEDLVFLLECSKWQSFPLYHSD